MRITTSAAAGEVGVLRAAVPAGASEVAVSAVLIGVNRRLHPSIPAGVTPSTWSMPGPKSAT